MKKGIHPTYHQKSKVTCVCGTKHEVGPTLPEFRVEICSNCHPFFTGGEKVIDTAGRVERFKKLRETSSKTKAVKSKAKK